MLRLKDIAARMDNCHPRTATRWWKKLDRECRAAGLPGVAPDVTGHGPDKWIPATAEWLLTLWRGYYAMRGTTPRKFVGGLPDTDPKQLDIVFPPHAIQNSPPRRPLGMLGVRSTPAAANHAAQPEQLPVSQVRRRTGVRAGERAG